jgi:prophage maintenance system killer protein
MSSFPTEQDMIDIHAKVADLVGCSPELADPDMLRAVILGVRLSRRGGEVHRGPFERAAALVLEIVERQPFAEANAATALAGALLYLSRHGRRIEFGKGQAASLMEGARNGSLDEQALAALLRLRVVRDPAAA